MNPPSRAALSRLASAARSAGTRGPRSSLAFATPPSGAHPAPRIPNPRLGVSSDRRGFAAASASALNAPAAPAPKSNSWLGAALLLSPSLVCAFLCKWQVDRHHWKKGELAAREAALSAPELTLRELIALVDRGDPPPEYARVHVEGELDVARSVRVAPRTRSVHGSPMPGAILITPLAPRRRGGRAVLVNRGWVPADWEEPRGGACVRTSGVVRVSETPSRFTPHNVDGRWHWIDAPAIAVAAGLPPNTPMVQLVHGGEADRGNAAPTSFPAPVALADLRKFRVDPGDHINYAATWGGLAAATGRAPRGRSPDGAAVARRRQRRRDEWGAEHRHTPVAVDRDTPSSAASLESARIKENATGTRSRDTRSYFVDHRACIASCTDVSSTRATRRRGEARNPRYCAGASLPFATRIFA